MARGPYREAGAREPRPLGRYDLLERLSDSPLGARWIGALGVARRTSPPPVVALHVLEIAPEVAAHAAFDDAAKSFIAFVRVSDPRLENAFELTSEDAAYVVSEYIAGERVERFVAAPLGSDADRAAIAAYIVGELARGVGALHGAGLVHGGITPRRAIVDRVGRVVLVGAMEALLLSLAPARAAHALRREVPYKSPEVLRGAAPDARADVFALGVVLLELVSAARRLPQLSAVETLAAALASESPLLPEGCPSAVARVIERAVARNPNTRFADGLELGAALGAATQAGRARVVAAAEAAFAGARASDASRLAALGLVAGT